MSTLWIGAIEVAVAIAFVGLIWVLIMVGTFRTVQYLRWSRQSKMRVIVGGALAVSALIVGGWMIYGIALLLPTASRGPALRGSGTGAQGSLISALLGSDSASPVDQGPSRSVHAQPTRPLRVYRWAIAGAFLWVASVGLAEEAAHEIANYPQPDRALWVHVMTWLPAFPIVLAVFVVCIGALRRLNRRRLAARFSIVLFWSSLAVIFTVVPKPA